MTNARDMKVTHGSSNVFADLGFEDAEDRLAKSQLALQISKVIKSRRLTQTAAAERLGIDQPKISRLLQGKLRGFSTAQLIRFLNMLGHDVEIVLRERPRQKRGKLSVHAT
jgi:predicted XRE-type DNA-binding protein